MTYTLVCGDECSTLSKQLRFSAISKKQKMLRIERRPGFGRCLVTMNEIKEGQTFFLEKPSVMVVNAEQCGIVCGNCFSADESLEKCTGCPSMYYCSDECRDADSRMHEMECKGLQRVNPHFPNELVRMACRMLIGLSLDTDGTYALFVGSLHCNREAVSTEASIEYGNCVKQVTQMLDSLIQLPSASVLLDIVCKARLNAMEYGRIGTALLNSMSAMNHSCVPNAEVSDISHDQFAVRAIRNIAAEDQICISYINDLQCRAKRKERLSSVYGFCCSCQLCNGPEVSEKRDLVKCSDCNSFWIENDVETECECEDCDLAERELIQKQLQRLTDRINESSDTSECCSDLLQSYSTLTRLVHPTHSLAIVLRRKLIAALVDAERAEEAFPVITEQLGALKSLVPDSHSFVKEATVAKMLVKLQIQHHFHSG